MDKDKDKNRCSFCNKKLKLISYSCKCEGHFCAEHRYTHTHNCTNMKEKIKESKEILNKNNPVIIHNKVIKI